MKKFVIMSEEDFEAVKLLVERAKSNLGNAEVSYYTIETMHDLDEIENILTKEE